MTVVITRKVRDKRPTDSKQAWYTDKQKYEVVAAYILFGNIAQVSRMTGVPDITCRKWKASPWWKEAEDEIRRGAKVQLSGKLTKAIELANLALEDRLQNGDFIFDYKTGQMIRKPVTADTAARVLDRLIDRQDQLEQRAQALDTTTKEGVNERLAKLAEDFLKFAKAKEVSGTLTNEREIEHHETIDVQAENVVVQELPEGEVQQAPSPDGSKGESL